MTAENRNLAGAAVGLGMAQPAELAVEDQTLAVEGRTEEPSSNLGSENKGSPGADDESVGAAHYTAKAKSGVKLMLARQVFIQISTFAGGIVLARTLTPEIFGIFGISMFLVSTIALFGDFGLAPSLIQRKEDLTDSDLRVAFTLQQILLTSVAVTIWIFAPFFLRMYHSFSGPEYVWLIRVMAFTLFLQSWRSMSILQMERHLNFKKIARIEIFEVLSFQCLAVTLALAGFGVWTLVWATLTSGLLGTSLAYASHPWRVRLAWDSGKAKQILRFGLPFQAGTLLNSASGWVTPLMVGMISGSTEVGYVIWADSNGRKPSRLMDIITRVAFPHFSRMQGNWQRLAHAYERYLYPAMLLGGFWLVLMVIAAPDIVRLVYTEKWLPAVPALQIFTGVVLLGMLDRLTGTLLRSTGYITFQTTITGIGTGVMLALSFWLVPQIGFIAIPLTMAASFTVKIVFQLYPHRWELVPILASVIGRVSCGAVVATIAALAVESSLPESMARLVLVLAVSFIAYFSVAYLAAPAWLRSKIAASSSTLGMALGRRAAAR